TFHFHPLLFCRLSFTCLCPYVYSPFLSDLSLTLSLSLQAQSPATKMAMQEGSPAPAPCAQVVGNAFVEQYYQILHQSPGVVHRFYQDISLLSRPDDKGAMTTVTTMLAINDKILSLNYEDYTVEIKTADAQESHEKGVIVLVTGLLTGKDDVRKKFTQTFFLAPQDKGYFVLNDVFRYVEENESQSTTSMLVNGINGNAQTADLTPEPVPSKEPVPNTVEPEASIENDLNIEVKELNNGAEGYDSSVKDDGWGIEKEVVVVTAQSIQNENLTGDDSAPVALEDAPKKSYASIVKVTTTSSQVYVPTNKVRTAPANTNQQSFSSAKPAPAPESSAPTSDSAPESNNFIEEAEGHSIYVRNLPYNATPAQLEEKFKKYGPIKPNGIQVRSNKQGSCFGFVEFEMLSSMYSALEASPITIGDHEAAVEEKRTNSRVGSSGRGRYSTGRVGFRNDSLRARGNFSGGRGYGRNESRNQVEFTGRPKGPSGRSGEGYQRANQNGSGRGGRQGGVNRSSLPA
ncbi:RRM_1 domain-containing protein/NTF2 domain-containing protein, partial [Cephalotus follicularis]